MGWNKFLSFHNIFLWNIHFKDVKFFEEILSGNSVEWNGILLPKLFRPTVRKNCSSDRKKLLKFEAEGREFSKFLRSFEQFIQTVKG